MCHLAKEVGAVLRGSLIEFGVHMLSVESQQGLLDVFRIGVPISFPEEFESNFALLEASSK